MEKKKKSLKDYVKGKTVSGQQPNIVNLNPEIEIKRIEESKDSTAVFAFGRFNPPTIGHEKLIHKVHQVAHEHGGQAHVIASHSQGTAKDPLPQNKKIEYLKKVAPEGVHVSGSNKENPSFLAAAKKLHDSGHKHLVMVAGSDRVKDYEEKLNAYNGREGHYKFKTIKVVSAGSRDPDAEGVEGMSGTKIRSHARAGEHKQFKAGLPKALHPHSKEIADTIRSVSEDVELKEAVLTIAQRRKRAINLKRREPRIQRARILALKRFASEKALRRRSRNLARELARVRFAGKRGGAYKDLSPSDKIAVDRQIQGKDKLIKALAARLYQRVRKREMARISRVRSGIKRPVGKQKTGMIASTFTPEFKRDLFESMFNTIVCEKYNINEKQLFSLQKKANESNLSLFSILDKFKESMNSNNESDKHTAEQLAYNKINSLVAEIKKRGLWANIHAKRARIKAGSGESMRKPGSKGAPSKQDFIDAQENFMDGKNAQDKGDMARHGLKGMSIARLKKVRSSDTASPRKKQLAHWFINMHKGKN